ncbi:MAG: 16S rRNA processing protein RimM [Ignavibacteriae bacterium HGW-Ignavibacteriae-4]|nr:MAG: 16S rRNA processing protein RimM [Ignavibacteriae bacterium HGW-Ignavibacteriae-4]
MSEYILVGVIVKTKGYKGEMIVIDIPKAIESVSSDIDVKIGYSEQFARKFRLTQFKRYQKNGNLKLKEIDSDADANALREHGLFVLKTDVNRRKNTYIDHELAGCKVYNIQNNELLGEIVDIMELPANDVWVMRTETAEIPLPVIDDVIKSVDIEKKEIRIELMDGLMDLEM